MTLLSTLFVGSNIKFFKYLLLLLLVTWSDGPLAQPLGSSPAGDLQSTAEFLPESPLQEFLAQDPRNPQNYMQNRA